MFKFFYFFVLELEIVLELDFPFLYRAEKLVKGWNDFKIFSKKNRK